MSGNQLSAEKNERIKKIIDQWEKEIEKIEADLPPSDGSHFDGPRTWARVELEKKYMPMIQAIKDE